MCISHEVFIDGIRNFVRYKEKIKIRIRYSLYAYARNIIQINTRTLTIHREFSFGIEIGKNRSFFLFFLPFGSLLRILSGFSPADRTSETIRKQSVARNNIYTKLIKIKITTRFDDGECNIRLFFHPVNVI